MNVLEKNSWDYTYKNRRLWIWLYRLGLLSREDYNSVKGIIGGE